MRVYRVFPHLLTAAVGEPGHPLYAPLSRGKNRLDNPGHYSVRYYAESPVAAVAEALGQHQQWVPDLFLGRPGSGMRRALAVYDLPDSTRLLDLDNAQALVDRGLRPTEVVRRNLRVTQAWSLRIYEERKTPRGGRAWDGVKWWSWYRPEWPVLGLWEGEPEVVDVQPLSLKHPSVQEAASSLGRLL